MTAEDDLRTALAGLRADVQALQSVATDLGVIASDLATASAAVSQHADAVDAYLDQLPVSPPPPPPPPPPVVQTTQWGGPVLTAATTNPVPLFARGPSLGTPWRTPFGRSVPNGDFAVLRPGAAITEAIVEMVPSTLPLGTRVLASSSADAWLPFDGRHASGGFELDLRFPTGWSWPKTMKWGGLVGWDGDWATWPGGGRPTGRNASVRFTANDFDHAGRPRLAAYLYLGGVWSAAVKIESGALGANWVANDGHTVEILLDSFGAPPIGQWFNLRYEATSGADGKGGLDVKVNGESKLKVSNVPWFADPNVMGWNLGYLCTGFGGDTPDFNPTSTPPWRLDVRNIKWFTLP